MGVLCALSLAGCMEKDLYQAPEEKTADEYFGFTTSSSCTVDLNYGLNYQVVFELYAENPLSEDKDGNIIKTKEEPVYRGATDKKGIFNDFISIPSYLTELYLYSDYLGTVSPIQLQITNGKVSFDQKAFIQSKRSLPKTLDPMKVTLEEAEQLILEKRAKEAERHIKKFDEEPELEILNGRYGPYIAYKGNNYKIPKDIVPQDLSLKSCLELVKIQDEKGPGTSAKGKRTAKKK